MSVGDGKAVAAKFGISPLDTEAKDFVAGALKEALDVSDYRHGEDTIALRLPAVQAMMECAYRAGYYSAFMAALASDKKEA